MDLDFVDKIDLDGEQWTLHDTELRSMFLDTVYPIGSTYVQYPSTKSPQELFPSLSWKLLDFGGAFFRAEGGNATDFDNEKAISAVSGNTITIANHGAAVGSVIYDPANNESRLVTAVSGNVITLDSQFTSTELRNVLVGQGQATAKNGLTVSKSGTVSGKSQTIYTGGAISLSSTADVEMNHAHSGNFGTSKGNRGGSYGDVPVGYTTSTGYVNLRHRHSATFTPSVTDSISVGLGAGDIETRPMNCTVRIWKRIA